MVLFGISETKHQPVSADYLNWGIQGSSLVTNIKVDQTYIKLINLIDPSIKLTDYVLAYAYEVTYYQGDKLPSIQAILIRLIYKNSKNNLNNNLKGEHISLIYQKDNNQLLGYTRMQSGNSNDLISHQDALNKACQFLKQFAPDLIRDEIIFPKLTQLLPSKRIAFKPTLTIGSVELQWIDEHSETIKHNDLIFTITGLKVKMYLPKTDLWAWVIIDRLGQIITFERNISWNFDQMKRETQMWLHDKWLIAQQIF